MFIKNYRRNTCIILAMIIYAFFIPKLCYRFRFIIDYRWIYQFGVFSGFAFYFISLALGLLNAIYILIVERNWRKKIIWTILTIVPFCVFIYVFY
tara:strand:+ start:43 stop:327 length:285 start_codon:yes stop_codon:yes gene_type:complete